MARDSLRIKASRRGGFDLRIPDRERDLLRGLPDQMKELLTEGDATEDPVLRRLYPLAYGEDHPEESADFEDLTRDDLTQQRLASAEIMEQTLDETNVTEDELLAWLSTLNDLRLVLGTRLEVTEDTGRDDFKDPGDAGAFALYGYLTFMEGTIVEALSG